VLHRCDLSPPRHKTDSWCKVYNFAPFHIYPPLIFLTVASWLTVKFHHLLIGLKVKNLITFSSLSANYLTVFPRCVTYMNPNRRPTGFSKSVSVTNMISAHVRFKTSKIVKVQNFDCSESSKYINFNTDKWRTC